MKLSDRTFFLGILLGVLIAAVGALSIGTAGAHSFDDYFSDRAWQQQPTLKAGNLQSSLDGSAAARQRVTDDALAVRLEWNNVPNSNFTIGVWQGFNSSVVWTGSACTTASWGQIVFVTYNMSDIGSESTCGTSTAITRSAIRLDIQTWKSGGGSVSSSQRDFRGVLMHEVGHSAGYGDGSGSTDHFSGSSTCAWGSSRNTMCYHPLPKGKTWYRTLESHDEHTLAGFY